MAYNVLIVDDESDIRELVSGILEDNDYKTRTAGSYVEAEESINKLPPNLVILDVWLGDSEIDGMRLLEFIKRNYEYVPVIMMSGHGTIKTAITAIQKGAYDFIEKPFDSARLLTSIEKAIDAIQLKMENTDLKIKAKISDDVVGNSQNVHNIRNLINKIAPLNGRCVILGTNGSDKEVVARAIHKLSTRAKSPFVTINCRAYSEKQLETELFGYEVENGYDKTITNGILEKVNGGILFIDELAYTSLKFQQKILDILKRDSFCRIGSKEKISLDVRFIVGLPLDIENLIKNEAFINELYYRINANVIKILPLIDRKEDIPCVLEYYMEQSVKLHNTTPKRFAIDAMNFLTMYPWSGDVMQVKNMVDWILTIVNTKDREKTIIELDDLPKEMIEGKHSLGINSPFISAVSKLSIKDAREIFEKEYFIEQLKRFEGNVSQIAKFVDMERSALHRKLKALGIGDPKSFRKNDKTI